MRAWSVRHRAVLLPMLACIFGASNVARALDTEQLQRLLRVRRGVTCLSAESLAAEVEQWVYDEPLPQAVVIEVDGSWSDPQSASFRVIGAGRTIAHRAFEPGPPRCEHLRAALGLAIALAFKASLLDGLGRPLADDPQARVEGWSLTAAGLATYRLLPGFAPGLELRAMLGLGRSFALRVGVLGVAALGVDFERAAGGFDAVLSAGRADACVRAAFTEGPRVQVCAGVLAGALYAGGYGGPQRQSALLGWVSFVNAASASVAITERWSLGLEVSVSFLLRPLSLGVRDSAGREVDARSVPSVGYVASLGPSYDF